MPVAAIVGIPVKAMGVKRHMAEGRRQKQVRSFKRQEIRALR